MMSSTTWHKVLYESVISAETRKAQGEYYTPDWLAEQVVSECVTDPLQQRVLDPSCGSGTFLFHSARRYLAATEAAGIPLREALHGLTNHVAGIDLHPVAVALARVTYLLAIARRLTDARRGPIRVPVFLGDSVQWDQRLDLLDLWPPRNPHRRGRPVVRERTAVLRGSPRRRLPLRRPRQRSPTSPPTSTVPGARCPRWHTCSGGWRSSPNTTPGSRQTCGCCVSWSTRTATTFGPTTFATSHAPCGCPARKSRVDVLVATRPGCPTGTCPPGCRSGSRR
ncbi:N-6 DNA methylase [Salinispora arenicola]|uniref:N-6 DNA methylase n=1 Tax=Salinispora arenicola TaxID=168697 RepID=UPI00346657F8